MDFLSFSIGALAIIAGTPKLLRPKITRDRVQAARNHRIQQLNAGAKEHYFEERRAIDAYPPIAADWKTRAFGGFLVAIGLTAVILSLLR